MPGFSHRIKPSRLCLRICCYFIPAYQPLQDLPLINFFGLCPDCLPLRLSISTWRTNCYDRHNKTTITFSEFKANQSRRHGLLTSLLLRRHSLAELMRQHLEIERTSRLLNINNILITAGNESFLWNSVCRSWSWYVWYFHLWGYFAG